MGTIQTPRDGGLTAGARRARELRLRKIRETHLSAGSILDNRTVFELQDVKRCPSKAKDSAVCGIVRLHMLRAYLQRWLIVLQQHRQARPSQDVHHTNAGDNNTADIPPGPKPQAEGENVALYMLSTCVRQRDVRSHHSLACMQLRMV